MNLNQLYQLYASQKLDKHNYIEKMHKKHQILFEYLDYIKDSDIASITIDNENIFVTIKETGLKLYLDPFDSRFIPIEIINFKSFDLVERALIFELARQSETIFDIGANIGWYTLNFSILENVKTVYSFEPIPRTFDFLSRHVALNQCDKAILNNIALSNENGKKEFFWNVKETGSSSMKNIQERKDSNTVLCQLQTLDNFCTEKNAVIDMIKCDVEGSELLVFQGAMKTIKRDTPFIFTEMLRKWSAKFGYHPNDIIQLLTSIDYRCFAYENGLFTEFQNITDETEATNYFFLHKEKHQKIISIHSK